jgi:hypothetical protein
MWDYRTRTVVSLFGAVDLTRAWCRGKEGWRYALDEALGLVGCPGWTVGVQEALSLLSCERAFQTVSDSMSLASDPTGKPPNHQNADAPEHLLGLDNMGISYRISC